MTRLNGRSILATGAATGLLAGLVLGSVESWEILSRFPMRIRGTEGFPKLLLVCAVPALVTGFILLISNFAVSLLSSSFLKRREPGTAQPVILGVAAGSAALFWNYFQTHRVFSLRQLFGNGKLDSLFEIWAFPIFVGFAVGSLAYLFFRRLKPSRAWAALGSLLTVLILVLPFMLVYDRSTGSTGELPGWGRGVGILLALPLWAILFLILDRFLRVKGDGRSALAAVLMPTLLLFLLLGGAYALPGGDGPKVEKREARKPDEKNLILLSVDTLRRDGLGCFGSEKNLTPRIDGLAREGVSFLDARANSPWTLPSMASLMTGLEPSVHGAMRRGRKLPDGAVTWAEAFRDAGFRTHAIVTNPWLRPTFGFDQGFQTYSHSGKDDDLLVYRNLSFARLLRNLGWIFASSEDTNLGQQRIGKASEWLQAHGDEKFFLWIHLLDPHYPFFPPPEFQSVIANRNKGQLAQGLRVNGVIAKGNRQAFLTRSHRESIRELYDLEVQYIDYQVGTLLDILDEFGLSESTAVVFVSDHGEELFDHDALFHGHSLYDELIRIPMILRLPGVIPAGTRLEGSASLVNLLPTLADLLNVKVESQLLGRSLTPAIMGEEMEPLSLMYSEGLNEVGEKKSITDGRYKLIHSLNSGRYELYDLTTDPYERRDLAREQSELLEEWKVQLEARKKALEQAAREFAADRSAEVEIDPEIEKDLRSLGYLQ